MSAPTDAEVEVWIESLDRVPNLPGYAVKALDRLVLEVRRARADAKLLRVTVATVKEAVDEVEP